MNKTGKIVLWSVIAIVLTSVLVWGITGGVSFRNAWSDFMGQISQVRIGDFVDNLPENSQRGTEFEMDVNGITEISLSFVDENIKIVPTDDQVIRVEETSSRAIKEEDKMSYGVKNGELVVQSGRNGRIFGWWNSYAINVTVMMPRAFIGKADISTVSGAIATEGMNAQTLNVSTTSGDISMKDGSHEELKTDTTSGTIGLNGMQAEKFRANTTSGDIRAEGSIVDSDVNSVSGTILIKTERGQRFEADTTSGSIGFACVDTSVLEKISTNSVSGSVEISLPEKSGFTVSFDTISGSQNNDFAMKGDTYADGRTHIDVNTTSGSLSILEK